MRPWRGAMVSVDLPVDPGLPMGGYAARTGVATHTLDPLTATIWVIQGTDHRTLCWVGLDSLAVTEPLRAAIEGHVQARHPGWHDVLVSATHTHSGPAGWHGTVHPVLPAELDESLIARTAQHIAEATTNVALVEVDLSVAHTRLTGVASNRHSPEDFFDDSARVLSMRHRGDLIGVVLDFACHPTVLGPDNLGWSADLVAGVRAGLPAGVPLLFLQGAAGDVSTRFTRREATHQEAHRLGAMAAAKVREALALGGQPIAAGRITVRTTLCEFPTDTSTGQPAPLAGNASGPQRDAHRASQALASDGLAATMAFEVSLVEVGSLRWLTLPLELGNQRGSDLAGEGDLRVVGYTNGYAGYLVDRAAHLAGHYEAVSSFFDAETSEAIQHLLVGLVHRLSQPGQAPPR